MFLNISSPIHTVYSILDFFNGLAMQPVFHLWPGAYLGQQQSSEGQSNFSLSECFLINAEQIEWTLPLRQTVQDYVQKCGSLQQVFLHLLVWVSKWIWKTRDDDPSLPKGKTLQAGVYMQTTKHFKVLADVNALASMRYSWLCCRTFHPHSAIEDPVLLNTKVINCRKLTPNRQSFPEAAVVNPQSDPPVKRMRPEPQRYREKTWFQPIVLRAVHEYMSNVYPGLINPMVVSLGGSHFKGDLSLLGIPPLIITIGVY